MRQAVAVFFQRARLTGNRLYSVSQVLIVAKDLGQGDRDINFLAEANAPPYRFADDGLVGVY